jgi:glycosyltransferase involved in cell wall biosynthesis
MRLFFLCRDNNQPVGGVRMLYRHVDILNASGFEALVTHYQPGFRITWFEHQTRVTHLPLDLRPDDLLVFPEIDGPDILKVLPGMRKVILNQNAYLTFHGYSLDPATSHSPYVHPDMVAAIVVSKDNQQYLEHAFPQLRVHRISYAVDASFTPPSQPKRSQLAYMPRKHKTDAQQVLNILKLRGVLNGWSIVPIEDVSPPEVARIMQESAVFLSFGYPEGFGLPPAEAMACGCITVGYHGNGGREYFLPEFSFPIEAADILGYAKTVESVLLRLKTDPLPLYEMAKQASSFIRSTYSPEREERDVVSAWRQIVTSASQR